MQAFGIMRLSLALGLSLGICAAAAIAPGIAIAQSSEAGIAALSRALQAYDSGDYDKASASIEEAFKGGLSKEFSARAILLRGQIHERNGVLARALQDYSNALWMDALPAFERKKASDGKQRVIAAMGLNNLSPPAEQAAAPKQANKPAGGSGPAVAQAAPEKSSGGFFGMFNGLFSSSKSNPEPAPPPAQEAKAAARPAPSASPASSASSVVSASAVHTRPKDTANSQAADPAPARKIARAEKAPPAPPKAVASASFQPVAMMSTPAANGFLIVFGPAANETAGRSKAQQIKTQLADILVSREVEVEANPAGGYRIFAGPYKVRNSALALCSAMKQRGVPCEVTQ
jgi:hypothetical protein